jgi:hypothetical protein
VISTFAELATRHPRSVVEVVLAEEVGRGRVRVEDGDYALVAESFQPEVVAALARLGPAEPDGSGSARRVHVGARPSGELARQFG